MGTYSLKGFLSYPQLTNNNVGEVAALGEISKKSLTYSKETGFYKDDSITGVLLHTFSSIDSVTGLIPVPSNHQTLVLSVGKFILDNALSGAFDNNATNILTQLETWFTGSGASEIAIGTIIDMPHAEAFNGIIYMPEWISFKYDSGESTFRLWLCDNSFSTQYDEFEFVFIPPIENIDDFFLTRAEVETLVASYSTSALLNKVDVASDGYPYTTLRSMNFDWVDRVDPTFTLDTNWVTLVYGAAGNDAGRIRDSLITWILDNSTHDRTEWQEIFPGLFTPNEFILIPLFNQFAIPNETIQDGLYSPVISLEDAVDASFQLAKGAGYSEPNLLKNTCVATTPYTPLGFLAVGNELNAQGISDFRMIFPDYVGIPVSSADFGRLSLRTQNWVYLFIDLIEAARTMTSFSVVPPGISRTVREGVVYAVKTYEGIDYLVACKDSVITALGIKEPYEPEYDPEED